MTANPFSTRFTRPGAIEFSSDLVQSHRLVETLAKATGRSNTFQIVGPHGCGKTTLTIAIASQLAQQGTETLWLTIRGNSKPDQVRFDRYLSCLDANENPDVLVIDGIESVNAFQRNCILREVGKHAWRVILTTHRALWRIPVLTTLSPSLEVFEDLCSRLICSDLANWNKEDWRPRIETAYGNANGDFREAFFELYDQYELCVDVKQVD